MAATIAIAEQAGEIGRGTSPFGVRFVAFLGAAAVYGALATMNAWPNIDAAMHGGEGATKAAAMAFVQYVFAFIVAISSVASAHEKGGQVAVLVFMLVNGYFAYDASSHRHDEAHTIISRKAIVEAELNANTAKRKALGDFERVSEKQVKEAEHKRDAAEAAKDCWTCSKATRKTRDKAAKDAQDALDRLLPLRTKTEDANSLDKAIVAANAELKTFKATGDSDNNLASMAGGNAATLSTALTLLIALGIELANKYGPFWTFRFLAGGFGYPQASPYEIRKAQKAADKARKRQEADEAEERRREAEEREEERQRVAEARLARELEARAAADAKEKDKAARKARRAEAETRKKGDPATVGTWFYAGGVMRVNGNVVLLSVLRKNYEAYCRAHGEEPVVKEFGAELRKLGVTVEERNRRTEVHGLALASSSKTASRGGLRVVFSR